MRACDRRLSRHSSAISSGSSGTTFEKASPKSNNASLVSDPFFGQFKKVRPMIKGSLLIKIMILLFLVPNIVLPILNGMRQLRTADETLYLRSASINIFNGMISLTFSCDGSHYMSWKEFLDKDMSFWVGCAA